MVHGKSSDTPSVHQTTQISYHFDETAAKNEFYPKIMTETAMAGGTSHYDYLDRFD